MQHKPKIWMHTDNSLFGGADVVFLDLALELRSNGFNVKLSCMDHQTEVIDKVNACGFHPVIFRQPAAGRRWYGRVLRLVGLDLVLVIFQIVRRRASLRADISLVSAGGVPGAVSTWASILVSQLVLRQRTWLWVHNLACRPSWYPLFNHPSFQRHCHKLVDSYIFVSHAAKKKLAEIHPAVLNRSRVLPNIIPDPIGNEGRGPRSVEGAACSFVYAGLVVKEKGLEVLIRAWRLYLDRRPDLAFRARLNVFGDGPDRSELEEFVKKMGLEGSVVFRGWVQDRDEIYSEAEVLVLPTLRMEGLPTVVLEAFARGVIPIATDVGGTGEAIVSESDGFLVPPGNEIKLAEAFVSVSSLTPDARVEMINRGRIKFDREFSRSVAIQRWMSLLSNALKSCSSLARDG